MYKPKLNFVVKSHGKNISYHTSLRKAADKARMIRSDLFNPAKAEVIDLNTGEILKF